MSLKFSFDWVSTSREGYATGTCTGLVRCQFMLPQAGSMHAVAIRAEPTAACLTAASSMTGPPVSKTAATSSMIEQRLCQQCAARRAWLFQPTDRATSHTVTSRSAYGLAHRKTQTCPHVKVTSARHLILHLGGVTKWTTATEHVLKAGAIARSSVLGPMRRRTSNAPVMRPPQRRRRTDTRREAAIAVQPMRDCT